ncbi:PAAR domain-containing protein [Pendulispora rubella]|uniref:PAAR domain-containing protein n=1 Tax=Pendulispora rubella TaxID=2741070 RepID=A0ABZ2LFX7_9BACT
MSYFSETVMPGLKATVQAKIEPAQQQAKAAAAAVKGGPAVGAAPAAAPGEAPPPKPPVNPVATVMGAVGAVQEVMSMPIELINTGVAMVANLVPYPSFPAATMGSMYIAPPHAHSHPPSLIPPAPPVPLPSIGAVLLGCTIKCLINYMPAARAGDIGLALTCCGIMPMFEIKTGSATVFIGGVRAARMLDIAGACIKATSGSFRAAMKGMIGVGTALGVAGIASDAIDASQEQDAEMAKASASAAAIDAADMAIDMAASAISASMGSDPAIPPLPGLLLTGAPNVLIGGIPLPNIPDPVQLLLKKLKSKLKRKKKENGGSDDDMPGGCRCRRG